MLNRNIASLFSVFVEIRKKGGRACFLGGLLGKGLCPGLELGRQGSRSPPGLGTSCSALSIGPSAGPLRSDVVIGAGDGAANGPVRSPGALTF